MEATAEQDIILWPAKADPPTEVVAVLRERSSNDPRSSATPNWQAWTAILGAISGTLGVVLAAYFNNKITEKELESQERTAALQRAESRAKLASDERLALARLNAELNGEKQRLTVESEEHRKQSDECEKKRKYEVCVAQRGTANCNNSTFNVGSGSVASR